jgi:hypothetical protein
MITPDDILKRAERKYTEVLRAYLTDDELFPLEFPVGRLSKNLQERRRQIALLRERSAEVLDAGYHIQWKTINKRDLGKQTVPDRIIITNLDDYLTVLRRRTEFNAFCADVAKIRAKFPNLEAWLQRRPRIVIDYAGGWDNLLIVCDYFLKHPRPMLYLRELPIEIHTKFIEQHTTILRELLDELLPDSAIEPEETDFHRRFGVKVKPTLLRLRLLEEQLDWHYGLPLDDIMLPVEQAAILLAEHLRPRHVIIVENQINFLTLPLLPNSIGIFGGGFSVHVLRHVGWLANCDVIYWGDIDAHGFQILSDLRRLFPHTRSLMMDQQTFDGYAAYRGSGPTLAAPRYDCLTTDELMLATHVHDHNLRLEQEHIPQAYAVVQLKQAIKSKNLE